MYVDVEIWLLFDGLIDFVFEDVLFCFNGMIVIFFDGFVLIRVGLFDELMID